VKVVVVSHRHGLLPFAWRLKREGADVEVKVHRDRFDEAWEGRLAKFPEPEGVTSKDLAGVLKELAQDGTVILTDSAYWTRQLVGAPNVFGKLESGDDIPNAPVTVRLGAWWTGTGWLLPHVWFEEGGVWPLGLGPSGPGAGLLAQLTEWPEEWTYLLNEVTDQLKASEFQGLVQIGLWRDMKSETWQRIGLQGGWPFLHTHAFVSELEDFSGVLRGQGSPMRNRYVVVLPVSVPPWPLACNLSSEPQEVGGLTTDDYKNIFFHDVKIEGSSVTVAGTDGLVGVVRGSSNHVHTARTSAVELALKVKLMERQFRPDGGSYSEKLLLSLEKLGIS
jgi:hypothetical protein